MPVYPKNGLYYCVYYQGSKRVWEPFGRGSGAKEAAEARDLEIKLKKKTGQMRHAPAGRTSFMDLARMYTDARKNELADNTMDGILRTITTYAGPISKKPINLITMDDWRKIEQKMIRRKIKNRTINTYFVYLSNILDWAMGDGLMENNPWTRRKRLKERNRFMIDLFTIDEFNRILAVSAPHLAWILDTAYHTGVRPGPTELFCMKWEDVDWHLKRIRIYSQKTDTWRWQYPDKKYFRRMVSKHKQMQKKYPGCPWICSYNGRQITSVKRVWKDAKEKAGIKRRIRLYDIRHFYITYALANGANITELAERVGHVNPRMIVNVYAHLAKDIARNKPFKLPELKIPAKTVDINSRQRKAVPEKTA